MLNEYHNHKSAATSDGDHSIKESNNSNHIIEEGNLKHKLATKDPNRLVVNLSNFKLNPSTRRLLEKGLNFVIAPKTITVEDIICSIEESIKHLPENEAKEVRQDYVVIAQVDNWSRKRIREEIEIVKNPNCLNKDDGLSIS